MAETGLVTIIEGALMAAGEPVSMQRLLGLFDDLDRPAKEDVVSALEEVAVRCEDRGFELVEVASGYRFQVRQNLSQWVGRLWQERPQRYSRALLETLSLIAYRQPITRGEIEEIRGVAVSSNIIKTLHEREWIRVVGHRDVPGRPAMYATTKAFLDYFNLKSLEALPPLAEIRDLDNLSGNLPLEDPGLAAAANDESTPAIDSPVTESEVEATGVNQGEYPAPEHADEAPEEEQSGEEQPQDKQAGHADH
ncbi:segregation and condensation protein B [Luminiphilus syltensis NOR5-1B]|uniref:Segregation and condensation protein B n=1 Tax=Luminiphilus syltensis NOR5-1B TaxID=565045 RepID=B8KQJ8_9GAMM|nr:SMC-Scp complex subunit ScpB [Luminiphilus syltensis]EED36901.1 segregation and condensation protein B [Luminiphilus syltensis NOR5-1B]